MNVRRFEIAFEGGEIVLRVAMGLATVPLRQGLTLTPAAALELSSQLEAAVHRHCPAGLQPELPLQPNPQTTT